MKLTLATALALAAMAVPARSALVTSIPGGTIYSQAALNFFGSGPQSPAPGIVWTSTNEWSVYGYNGGYGLDSNGYWTDNAAYVGLNTDNGDMTFTFRTPVSAAGGFINYAPGYGSPSITAYDTSHNLIETAALSISTPYATNEGAFLGFAENSAVIRSFVLSNAYIVMRDLTVLGEPAPVPEPTSMAMLATGLIAVGLGLRRRAVRSGG